MIAGLGMATGFSGVSEGKEPGFAADLPLLKLLV